MINLLAAYYENIGPFRDKSCSIFFDEWKYLIKAPIWSWKSFLFFDAPRYALYKDSSRNMLNLHCKNWEISMIFEVDGEYYLIKRILKSTRMWNDSCASQLYNIQYGWDNLLKDIKNLTNNDEILQRWENFIPSFESSTKWKLEEIVFKNETDLQTQIECILPPKEVFLSTVFLLQDADNIFEMRPADRLIVLKNVFNLLWIDDAKEIVQERKREVQYKLKALQDHSLQDSKLRTNLKSLWNDLQQLESDEELKNILSENNQFFEDIEWFLDQISINNFSLNGLNKDLFEKAENLIQTKIDAIIKLNTQCDELRHQVNDIQQQKQQNQMEISLLQTKIQDFQRKIENIDVKKWNELKEKKLNLYQQSSSLEQSCNFNDFSEFISFWNDAREIDNSLEEIHIPDSLESAYKLLILWKDSCMKVESLIDSAKIKMEYIQWQKKNWEENQARKIERIKDQKDRLEGQIKQTKQRIEDVEKNRSETSDFDCPDICKKCPHISAINKQQFEQYSTQKQRLNSDLEQLENQMKTENFEQQITDLQNEKNPESGDKLKDLEEKIKQQEEFSKSIRNHLIKIWFNTWEKNFNDWNRIQNDIKNVDLQLLNREEETKNLESYQNEKIACETSLHHSEKLIKDLNSQIDVLNAKINDIELERQRTNSQSLQQQQSLIKQIHQTYSLLQQLVEDSVSNQNLSKQLEEEEKKLTRLYAILSKDIVLVALSDLLPVLCEVINWLLIQCVDYTLQMNIAENNDKLELEAKVFDEKWEREVKCLSGWQRTILKLVRMLAVSSYLRTPLLFLDETINNLDADTVGKVSEMINNFVKQRTMKFYTVTHNKEIQDMQIWDNIIEIQPVNQEE